MPKYGIKEVLEEDARPTLDVAQDKNTDAGVFPQAVQPRVSSELHG